MPPNNPFEPGACHRGDGEHEETGCGYVHNLDGVMITVG